MVEIIEVKTNKQIREFINFPLKLYKGCKYYVPELYNDAFKAIKYNNVYKDQAKSICLLAYKDNQLVGRIQGIIQYKANEKWNQKRIRFTRFDSINDKEVSRALFSYLENYALKEGLDEIVGPLGFSDLDKEGLLIEGFYQLSTFEESYNYEYYKDLIEDYGFIKEVDWEERKIKNKKLEERDTRFKEITNKLIKQGFHYSTAKNINEFINKYKDYLFDLLDETYKDIYGTVPFTEKMKESIVESFKLIASPKYVGIVLDKDENPAGFAVCFPSIAKSVNQINGKLYPFGFIKVLKEINNPDVIDLGLVGVLPKYRLRGVSAMLFCSLMDILDNPNIKYAETNLNLETNTQILNQWNFFEASMHKKRRCYIKKIK